MRVVHDPATEGDRRTLATDVEVAESPFARGRGLMLRRSVSEGYALVFPFGRPARRGIHTVGVRFPIDVVWTVEGAVTRVETMRPWLGLGFARADRVIELPAGAADGVEAGDGVAVVEDAP